MSLPASIKPSGKSLLRTFERVLGDRKPAAQPMKDTAGVLKPRRDMEPLKTFEFYGRNGNVKEVGPHAAGSCFDHTV